jgi:hypothetical protein
MRVLIFIALLFSVTVFAVAQDYPGEDIAGSPQKATNEYFPVAGDFGIGFDATPFLNYIGNAFNGTSDNSLDLDDHTLYFRYFLSNNSALRLSMKIGSHKGVNNYYVSDDAATYNDPLSQNKVEDRYITSENEHSFSVGYMQFRGNTRFRGFYGADLAFGLYKYSGINEYGNKMTVMNPQPTSHNGASGSRITEWNNGTTLNFGAGLLTGAEYYILPKVALGVELGFVYGQSIEGQSNAKRERMVQSLYVIEDVEYSPGNRRRGLASGYPYGYGNLYLMIQF